MLEPSSLAVFIAAGLALLITPGPAVLYIVTRSIDQGRRAGMASVLGIEVGGLVHVAAASLGLSALLVSSALAFSVVKYLGAFYLIYLGIRRLLEKSAALGMPVAEPRKLPHLFAQGIVVNVLNPKEALFFFAFLPQFVDPSRGQIGLQVLLLGLIFQSMAVCSDSLYALLAGTARDWLRGSAGFLRGQRYFTGGVLLALGVGTAVSGTTSR